MSRESPLVAALGSEPVSTSDLYERIGYRALTQLGLVPYPAFRAALGELESAGLVRSATADDGSTVWRRAREAQSAGGPPS
jgi:DNA-binding transcriptional ArsR family regulator